MEANIRDETCYVSDYDPNSKQNSQHATKKRPNKQVNTKNRTKIENAETE